MSGINWNCAVFDRRELRRRIASCPTGVLISAGQCRERNSFDARDQRRFRESHSREREGIRQSPGKRIMQIAGWNPSPSARPNVREFIRAPRRCTMYTVCTNSGCYKYIVFRFVRSYICPTPSTFRSLRFNARLRDIDRGLPRACFARGHYCADTRDLINERINRRY